MKIGLLAGESSGDNLGAGLMAALRREAPGADFSFVGVGGERMIEQGLDALVAMEALTVNGFRDPIVRLPRLIGLFRHLLRTLARADLDAFVGIDFNVFNLLLEKSLKRRGVKTVHYVSPSVYAWRRGRAGSVAAAADLLLCLYPFEPAFYASYPLQAVFVGHPLADEIAPDAGNAEARLLARGELGLPADALVLALLPGSRRSEVDLLLDDFLQTARLFGRAMARDSAGPDLCVVIPCVNAARLAQIEPMLATFPELQVKLHQGDARLPLTACDVALVKAGTSTLEAMLLKRPMVVSYRLGPLSYQLARRLIRTPHVALPNILFGRTIVPELLQDEGTPQALADNLRIELDKSRRDAKYLDQFAQMHGTLARHADREAARALCGLLGV